MTGDSCPNRSSIAASQLDQLRGLLAALIPANRFYTTKLAAAGAPGSIDSLDEFTKRFPLTTKLELVQDQFEHPPFGTNLTFPPERYTRFHQTSGTTGAPIRWLDTPESWNWMVTNWMDVFRAAGVGEADRLLFAFSFGPFIGFWLAFDAAQRLGALCLPAGGLSSAARLRMIIDNAATVLCCTPTYALRLAEVAAEEKIDLHTAHVKTIIVAGEPGGSVPATRSRLEQLWPGARVFDHHGMTEVGAVTHECPKQPGILHVLEPAYLAEVIDPLSGNPVQAGGTGELLLTPLGRIGSPLLRYRTGDLVKPASSPCACGRHNMALEGGILGRVDDMVIIRGVNIHPAAVEQIVRAGGDVAEFQVTLTSRHALAELSLRVEPVAGCRDWTALAKRLEKALHDAFALRVPVTAVLPGTLPRFEMKANRWVKQ